MEYLQSASGLAASAACGAGALVLGSHFMGSAEEHYMITELPEVSLRVSLGPS